MNIWSIATAAMLAVTAVGAVQQATKAEQPAPSVTIVAKPVAARAPRPTVVTVKPSKAARALKPVTARVIQAEPARIAEVQEPGQVAKIEAELAEMADAEAVWVAQEEQGPRVSASFNKAASSEVLDWLTKNGVNFVTAESELPKGETITLNVKDRPINEVLDAIASAMGGHWERRGGMRVFRKGEGMRFFGGGHGAFGTPAEGAWRFAPGAKGWTTDPGQIKVFGKDGEHKFITPEGMKEFKLDIKGMKEFELEKLKSLKELKDFKMLDGKARQEMEEAMNKAHKEMLRSGVEMKVSKKAMEEAHKAMEKAMKDHPDAFRGRVFVSPEHDGLFKVLPHGDGKNFEFRMDREGLRNKMGSISIDGKSFTKFVDSLSNEQRETNRRQGYLRARDLSEAQRKMLGINTRDKGWSITINQDGQQVTVKSND
jgi:hypothetical protein